MHASEYDWRIAANLPVEGSTKYGPPPVVLAGLGREGTEWEVLHTTREAEGTMAETARLVRPEQDVTHAGLVTV